MGKAEVVDIRARQAPVSARRRGRPRKFPEPSEVVALTLPKDVVRGLRRLHADIAWAIVTLFARRQPEGAVPRQPDAELVTIAENRSLIVVNRKVFLRLPGIHIIPLDERRAFLALERGRGMADLELSLIDQLADPSLKVHERAALDALVTRLRGWRQDHTLRFHSHAIIVVERVRRRAPSPSKR